jgi:dsRNA-specific ribonuclease
MTELKAWVVSRKVLAGAARTLELESLARVGQGMKDRALAALGARQPLRGAAGRRVPRRRRRIRAQLSRARRSAVRWSTCARCSAPRTEKQALPAARADAGRRAPSYVLLGERGYAHAKAFLMAAEIAGRRFRAPGDARAREGGTLGRARSAARLAGEKDPEVAG